MAKLTVQEVLEKKYLTDATLAEKLLLPEGTAGRLTLDDDIIKAHIHQVGAYIEVYGDQEERDSHDDGDSSNDIVFTVDGEEVTYTGKPTVAASTALKSLDITGTLYVGSEEFVTKGLKATDLAGLELTTSLPVVNHTVTWNAGEGVCEVETSEVEDGAAVGELPEVLPAEGYTFDGWFDASEEGSEVTAETVIDADVTFYAHYTEATPGPVENPAEPTIETPSENPDQGAE
jgi:uncharacterized repeat protein (TIGR02543 family)